jgi:hypothetical protein
LIATNNSTPLDAEQFRPYTSGALLSTGILEIDPRVALDIHVKVLVMMLTLARRLDEMNVCRTLVERALDLFSCQLAILEAGGFAALYSHRIAS